MHESVVRPSRMSLCLAHLQRYGLAVLSVGVAVGASLLFEHFHFRQAAGQLLLLAVAIDAWYGERGPALLSLILAILGMDYFFIPPLYSFRVAPEDLPYFTTFISLAVLVCWFSTVRRRV